MTTKIDIKPSPACVAAEEYERRNPNRERSGTELYNAFMAGVSWQARAALQSRPLTVDALAQEIRRVNGNNALGAGALAEALMPFLQSTRQSQDAEDAVLAEWMTDDGRAPWARNSLKYRIKEMRASEKRCRNAFRKDYMRVVSVYFADALGEAAEALEKRLSVIDHARRGEGEGE